MRLILPLLLIIVAGALFFGVTTGLFAKIDDLRLEQEQVKADEAEALKLKSSFTALNQQADEVKASDLAKLDLLLPKSVDTVDLLVKINGIAKNSAMTLADVKIKTEEVKNNNTSNATKIAGLGIATFNFSVTGSYGALRQFLSNLERNFRLVDISTISFSSVEREPYQYNIELKTYWLK